MSVDFPVPGWPLIQRRPLEALSHDFQEGC